jgi:hypothetical protein
LIAIAVSPESVVIHNFHVVSSVRLPNETNAKLIVDTNAMLACAVSFQSLQAIPGRNAQVANVNGSFQLIELSAGGKCPSPAPASASLKEVLCIRIPEALNHPGQVYNVTRTM